MPLEIDTTEKQKERHDAGKTHKLAGLTYVNADRTKVVPEGSSEAAYVLGGEGYEIPIEQAEALGLTTETKKAEPAEDKKLKAEAEDKSAKPKAKAKK